MNIKIYSTPTCPYCVQAKQYFKEKNIAFEDIDVSLDRNKAQEMIDLSGQMGVPIIKIDDKVITGFDVDEIEKVLNE
ncbi:MAG: Glutaredoxin-like protein, YruB-family [Berkelbacteria bacterium GW2011_GWA1_39_10]|uniref:Glutaredoxin-like protein, YruB-family n=1 Tax=Berkelbacteria bacterium GW2011_GWA1_39_10 TaxID=1618332 RepID=A0A0G0LHZ0_9BACT|nr:MAG: Glutaredoxin-like protein, YruB-family [Berkelbacteria bacterium GW2011_GWA1_39_10]